MSINGAILKRLAALKLPTEAFQQVLSIIAELEEGRATQSAAAVRQARYRDRKRNSDVTRDVTRDAKKDAPLASSPPAPSPPLHNPPSTPPTTPPKTPQKENARASMASWFDVFWQRFPNKVGKQAALKAFEKVLWKVVEPMPLLAGLQSYVEKTDDRPWCNPATWLNQHRWEDVPAARGPPRRESGGGFAKVLEELNNGPATSEVDTGDGRTIDHDPGLF